MNTNYVFFPQYECQFFPVTFVNQNKRIVKKPFTKEEDRKLIEIVNSMGDCFEDWKAVAERMETRSARQCRERWVSYLSPDIRFGKWTEEEDRILIDKINKMGKRWTDIAIHFNGRSGNDIKNRWYWHLKDKTFINDKNEVELLKGPFLNKRKRKRSVPSAHDKTMNEIQKSSLSENQYTTHSQNEDLTHQQVTRDNCFNNSIVINDNSNISDLRPTVVSKRVNQFPVTTPQESNKKSTKNALSLNSNQHASTKLPSISQLINNM